MNKTDKVWKMLEAQIVEASLARMNDGVAYFEGQPGMQKCYRDDHHELMAVAALLGSGKVLEAAQATDALDTILRDVIPELPWQVMSGMVEWVGTV
jgi:hypothetical protein